MHRTLNAPPWATTSADQNSYANWTLWRSAGGRRVGQRFLRDMTAYSYYSYGNELLAYEHGHHVDRGATRQGTQATMVSPTPERAMLRDRATTRSPARDRVRLLLSGSTQ